MTNKLNKLLVLSSGGDAPGMNAAIRSAVRTALYYGIEVFGAENGYSGLLEQKIKHIDADFVANCIQRGGTILKTGRCLNFHDKNNRARAIEYLNHLQIDGMIVLGGDGSFRGAALLANEGGPPVIGIPCTIDNDINGTEYTIGFDTACNTALSAIDKIRDTAFSLDRNFIVEVMGRSSGFIAVTVGIAGGAEIVLTPEFPMTTDELVAKIQQQRRRKLTSIIVAAEANQPGHSFQIAHDIEERSGINYKVCILGHTQRGGSPTVYDRKISSIMGYQAVAALQQGLSQKMLAIQNNKPILAPFPDPGNTTRYFTDQALLQMNEIICDI